MLRYRTEIVVPVDHYVCLQLPAHLPAGRAVVTVSYAEPGAGVSPEPTDDEDSDRQDIEWWEEFEGPSDPGE